MRKKKENKREMNGNLEARGVEWYREKIVEMVGQIDNEKFLRRIYIIISDNMKVKPE